MDNDGTLWKGVMQGDKEMFLKLYRKYYHTLLFIGLKEIKDAQLVKDVIQQQFLYLWEKKGTIREADNVRSYLIISFLRRLSANLKRSAKINNWQLEGDSYLKDPQSTPEEQLIEKDEHRHLSNLLMGHINALPSRQKELIVMKFYEGLSYDEIVRKTGLTRRTVYNKIHEAIERLKTDIREEEGVIYHRAALLSILFAIAVLPSNPILNPGQNKTNHAPIVDSSLFKDLSQNRKA